MQRVTAVSVSPDLDLAAGDRAIAENADALIVERIPSSARVSRLQDREFFFWQQVEIHNGNQRSKFKCDAFCHQQGG